MKNNKHYHLKQDSILPGTAVYLRMPRADELPFIHTLWADPETMKPVGGLVMLSNAQAEQWFNRMVKPGSPANCYCLIFTRGDNRR